MKTTVLAHANATPRGGLSAARYLLMLGMTTVCGVAHAAAPMCTNRNAKGGGVVRIWACWSDPQMPFGVDLL